MQHSRRCGVAPRKSGDDGEDASNIYAITDPATEHKGLLDRRLRRVPRNLPCDLSERLWSIGKQHRQVTRDRAPSKHGLRKVYKSEFRSDPERYVLREGFPRLPAMPFGQSSSSILGFDTAEQEYVWLVTSIIRDPRLIRFHTRAKTHQRRISVA
jgi:hypothetical protein